MCAFVEYTLMLQQLLEKYITMCLKQSAVVKKELKHWYFKQNRKQKNSDSERELGVVKCSFRSNVQNSIHDTQIFSKYTGTCLI